MASIQLIPLSSLVKVFWDQKPDKLYRGGSMLKNERFSFQVAYNGEDLLDYSHLEVELDIRSPLKDWITVRQVGNVPSELPCYPNRRDDNYLRTEPGLFPDPLYPVQDNVFDIMPGHWHSLWFTVEPNGAAPAGSYPVEIILSNRDLGLNASVSVEITIVDALLPEQDLICTNWFHTDCIATYYRMEVFSDAYWEMVEKFMASASRNGINMLLMPAFTPPLDTRVGYERPTVQLVEVFKEPDGSYRFLFDRLHRWIDLCQANGIRYYEHSHFFTQWGAKAAPKVMGWENGEYKRLFGWDTPATGDAYANFLRQYIPQLLQVLKSRGIDKNTYFHISDEPSLEAQENYAAARAVVADLLEGYRIFDALSNYEFYTKGLVTTPVPSVDHIEPFVGNVDELWGYYCCGQCVDVSNRFFAMPSARNRILGAQLYKYDVKGFLQWGFNFYFSGLSRHHINPFLTTDALSCFPSGDAFVVYPGEEGPLESLRLVVFHEAFQDLRALKLLEGKVGRQAVLDLMEEGIAPITFQEYPHSDEYILNLREKVNRALA